MVFQFNMKSVLEDIEYVCKVMFKVLKMPIYFVDKNDDIIFSFSYEYADNPFYPNKKELFSQLFFNDDCYNSPIIRSTKYFENYFAITFRKEDIFIGTFIVGSSTYSHISAETIGNLISHYKNSLSYKKELIRYYNAMPIMSYSSLINASLLLYYAIYNIKLDLATVMERNSSLTDVTIKIDRDYIYNSFRNRENVFSHHTYVEEKNILQFIKEGDKGKLLQYFKTFKEGEYGSLSKNDPLRSKKNFSISLVAITTRVAIEAGLNSELAFNLNDSYIQNIEEINEMKYLTNLNIKILCDFADRVHEVKEKAYSKAIILCKNYIYKNLYENIFLVDISKYVDLSPNYLSALFKDEVGITISEYIQKERIDEAKKLLVSSNYSILDIATWLNFCDQSYFTRIFKKYTGVSPKKYKDENIVI